MTRPDEELLADWLLDWEEAHERGRDVPAAELVGTRADLAAELARRIRILQESAWLDAPLDHDGFDGSTTAGTVAVSRPGPRPPRGAAVEPGAPSTRPATRPLATAVVLTGLGVAGIAIALRLGQPPAVRRTTATGPDSPQMARNAFFHARYAEADAGFTKLLEQDPDDHEALLARGISRLKLGRLDAAVADFTRALELSPADREALRQRAQAYVYLARYSEAITDLERLLDSGAADPATRQQIAALKAALAGSGEVTGPDRHAPTQR